MRNNVRFVISFLALGHLAGCAIDDSIVAPATGGGAGATAAAGAGGKGSGGTATAAGGKGGSGGSSTGAAGTGGRGGSTGGAGSGGGTGGSSGAGAGGGAGTAAGASGAMEAGPDGPPDAGPTDMPDAVLDAAPEVCAPETDVALCARVHKNCGSFLGLDNCGASRAVLACGRCIDDGAVCGSAGTLNTCPGTDPVNRAQGGMVFSTHPTSPPMGAVEGDLKVFDNDIHTKWYVRGTPTPSIAYDFGGTRSFAITSYTVTSANDAPDRDPLSWRLEGSNSQNLSTWTTLDTRTNETFASRGQTNFYSFANTTGYFVYRFTVTANNGNLNFGGEFQVAEIQLFGDPASSSEAGTDDGASADSGSAADAGSDTSLD